MHLMKSINTIRRNWFFINYMVMYTINLYKACSIGLAFFFASWICPAQSWRWATSCGKGYNDDYATIASDKSGNIYMTGRYSGLGIFGNDTLIPASMGGPYLPVVFCKVGPSGTFQWVKGISGSEYSGITAQVAMNKNVDAIYYYGQYKYNVHIGGFYLQSNTVQIFLARYDSEGNCTWAIDAGGNGGDFAEKACVDNQGNMYVTGIVYDTATFDSIKVAGGNYIAKYNAQGKCQWVKIIGNGSYYTCGLTTNGRQVILVGKATMSAPFYLDSYLLDPSESRMVIASFDSFGNTQWAKIEGKGPINGVINTGFDNNNSFYISGDSGGDLIFGDDTIINHSGSMDLFLVKCDSLGNPIWVRATKGNVNNWVEPAELTVGTNNNIYLTGYISFGYKSNSTSYFGSCFLTLGDSTMRVSVFVVGYDPDGNCIGVNQAPTDYDQMQPKGGTSVAVDSNGYCIVAGQFRNSTNFGNDTLTSMGERDIFIAKCGPFYGEGIQEGKSDSQLVIYANPTTGKCNITIPEELMHEKELTLTVYNAMGRAVERTTFRPAEEKIRLNLEAQAKGIYQVILENGSRRYSGKVVFE